MVEPSGRIRRCRRSKNRCGGWQSASAAVVLTRHQAVEQVQYEKMRRKCHVEHTTNKNATDFHVSKFGHRWRASFS